mmetsp:Transcript_7437/g.28171  ORF Transcript_7437/g.28171 Transcript_7437/m.28171 type:complete len:216 (+) Transcript_7437:307-954(+)|eukprot:scaffold8253_cov267-Pinguiococcus_pyrenoidosus.AAC.6
MTCADAILSAAFSRSRWETDPRVAPDRDALGVSASAAGGDGGSTGCEGDAGAAPLKYLAAIAPSAPIPPPFAPAPFPFWVFSSFISVSLLCFSCPSSLRWKVPDSLIDDERSRDPSPAPAPRLRTSDPSWRRCIEASPEFIGGLPLLILWRWRVPSSFWLVRRPARSVPPPSMSSSSSGSRALFSRNCRSASREAISSSRSTPEPTFDCRRFTLV